MLGYRTGAACAVLLLASVAGTTAHAAETAPWRGVELQYADNGNLLIRRQVIQDRQQWQQWFASPAAGLSPLGRLAPVQQQAFSRSLEFRDGGLANYAHEGMLRSLTAADAYQVLGLFGIEHELAFLPGVRVISAADRQAMAEATEALRIRQNPFARTQVRPASAVATSQPARPWRGD